MNAKAVAKRALITGANRGIGRETALELGRRGWQVIVAARQRASADEVVTAIRSAGGAAESLALDVNDSISIEAAARQFGEQFDSLDVLVNNAGVYPDQGTPILAVTRERMASTFATNTFGALEVTQRFLPYLRRAGAARIINLSSGYGQLDGLSPEHPSYCLSKLALNGLTLMLAQSLAGDGIAVNSVCPGWVRTDMGGPNADRSVEEGADTPVWLATEANPQLTGKNFRDQKEISW